MSEPRQFWIQDTGVDWHCEVDLESIKPPPDREYETPPIRVIEYSAYESMVQEKNNFRTAKLSKDIYCDQIEKEMSREIRDLKEDYRLAKLEIDRLKNL